MFIGSVVFGLVIFCRPGRAFRSREVAALLQCVAPTLALRTRGMLCLATRLVLPVAPRWRPNLSVDPGADPQGRLLPMLREISIIDTSNLFKRRTD